MSQTAATGHLFERVYLLGTGLIGGSLALDLKGRNLARVIVGDDRDPENARRALERGIMERIEPATEQVLSSCDLVVLAVPVLGMADLLRAGFPPETLVTDVGSVKGPLVEAHRAAAGSGHPYRYVPGHPIAGDERSGPEAARTGLFDGARVILTPERKDHPDVGLVTRMWSALGARVECMDPDLHDEIFAWVSHLPHMAAFALVESVLRRDPHWVSLSGGGLRDYTRIAASSPRMWADIAMSNRSSLLRALDGFADRVQGIRSSLEAGDRDGLEKLFASVAGVRKKL